MPPSTKMGIGRKPKKVQTRIAFAPEGSSSPAPEKGSLSPARVVLEGPKKSSAKAASSRSSSSQVASAPRTSQAQARLSFSSVAHNDDGSNIDDDGIPEGKKFAVVIRSSSANVSSPAKPVSSGAPTKQRKPATFMPKPWMLKGHSKTVVSIDSSEDEQVECGNEAGAPLKKVPMPARKQVPLEDDDDDDDEDDEPVQITPRIVGRRKPSYFTESDEEPLTKPPKATLRNGRVVIPGEKTPSSSPEPEELPQKPVNSRSFIAGGQLGQARYKDDYKPIVVGGGKSASPEKKTKMRDVIVLQSEDDSSDNKAVKVPPASSRKKASPHKNKEADEDSYDSEPAGYMLEHQAAKAGAKHKVFGTRVTMDEHPTGTPQVGADDEEEVSIVRSPIKRLQNKAKIDKKVKKPGPPAESDSEGETPLIPTPAKRRRLSPPPITDDEEDDLPIVPTPAKAEKGSKRARSSSSDFDMQAIPTPGNKRRKPSNPNSNNDVQMVDLDDDNDDGSLFGSVKSSPKKKVAPVAPMMVKATERPRVDKKRQDKEKGKLKTKGDTVAQRIRSSQPKKHRSKKEKAMELMRRKRNGEKITELTDSESSEEEHKPKMGMYDTDSDVEVLVDFDDEEEEEVNTEKIRKSLLPQNRNKNKESGDDDDFVIEDDDEPLGVPGGHFIPLEFTQQAHKKLSEHFKDAVEWMVQRRLNPGFRKDDPVYVTAFRKLDDDPNGLVNSKLVSTVWNAKFVRALKARPDYSEAEITDNGNHEGQKCAACNRGKHPVSFAVTLSGKPYNKDTLEEIDQSDNEDSDDSNASASSTSSHTVDATGNRLVSSKKQWFLGSTCKANASAAHGLIHWKHFLDEWVLDALQLEGWFKPKKLAERALWKKKQLDQLAMDVVDEWTETKQLKTLFQEFKARIEGARNLTHERYANR